MKYKTVALRPETWEELRKMKLYDRESLDSVVRRLITYYLGGKQPCRA